MKIGLISPKGSVFKNVIDNNLLKEFSHFGIYKHTYSGFGLSLLIIAALTPSSYEIDLIDENFEKIDFSKKYDLVGITAMTQQATRAYEIADIFLRNKIKVVIGGIHATVMPQEAKEHADSVVIGEVEDVWHRLLSDFRKNKLKPFYKSNKLVDLKGSPTPRYDLLNPQYYNVMWVQATRGCPHDCEFCAASKIYGKKYRYKTVDQVFNEIKLITQNIKKVKKAIQISFADDNLFVNRKFSIELINKITPLNIRWFAQTDISIAEDDELLTLLTKSGCICLFIGFETVDEQGLLSIDRHGWKLRQLKNYSKYIHKIQSYGVGVHGAFIVGLDSDDHFIFDKISNFIIENNMYDSQITICTPLPGTRLREKLANGNRLLPTKWENYTIADVNFIHPKLSKEDIEKGLIYMYRKINSKEVFIKKMAYFKEIQKKLLKK